MNEDSREDYLGLGIAEEIISSLQKNPGLQVLARAATFGVNPMRNIKELGEVLNAEVVLDGTLKKEKGKIFITAELTDIKSGGNVWVNKYNRQADELLAIQDEIIRDIIATLITEDSDSVIAGVQPHIAAQYCADLVLHSHSGAVQEQHQVISYNRFYKNK